MWIFGYLCARSDSIGKAESFGEEKNHFIWHALRLFYWSAQNQSALNSHLLWLPLFTITRFQFIAHCTVILLQFIKCNALFLFSFLHWIPFSFKSIRLDRWFTLRIRTIQWNYALNTFFIAFFLVDRLCRTSLAIRCKHRQRSVNNVLFFAYNLKNQ